MQLMMQVRTDDCKELMWADKLESTTIMSYVISKFKEIRYNANGNAGASQMRASRLAQAGAKNKMWLHRAFRMLPYIDNGMNVIL